MAPLLSNLLSPSAMDVIVARCRHGEMGIGDVLHVALQNCIIEKNAVHDSPKKPVHHRYRSHSSLLSSDTVTTIQPGVDPDALDSWQTILSHIDEHLCPSQPQELPLDILETLGDPAEPNQDAFVYLKDILHSHFHEQRIQGMHWVREWAFSRLEYCLRQEDRSFMVTPNRSFHLKLHCSLCYPSQNKKAPSRKRTDTKTIWRTLCTNGFRYRTMPWASK